MHVSQFFPSVLALSARSLNPVGPSAVFAGSGSESSALSHKGTTRRSLVPWPNPATENVSREPMDRKGCYHHDLLDLLVHARVLAHKITVKHAKTDNAPPRGQAKQSQLVRDASCLVTSSIVPKSAPSCACVVAKTRIVETPADVTKQSARYCGCQCRCRSKGSGGRRSLTQQRVHRGGR